MCFLFFLISFPAGAQLFKPFTFLRVIKTEYFDIIYPSESEPSARLLASYADRIYEQISPLLNIDLSVRIPVTFAPHTDLFNGYYNSVSSPHIVLYDTPMDLEWTVYEDNLKSLFIHELVHAFSLNTRGPFYRILHRVFGNWVSPAYLNAPLFMVEGVTVSFESLSGFGRANDPLIKQKLRQAVHENKFPSPFQVSGVYDFPGQGGNWYEYGGLFSAWLIQNYGMEKYAELWQKMGRSARISLFVYRSGYYRIFRDVYGADFIDEWNAFLSSFALENLEENHDELFPEERHFFTKRRNSVSALAAGKNNVYALDSTEEKIRVFDAGTGKESVFNTDSFNSYDIDVSKGGTSLLVSGYHITGERYKAVVTEFDVFSGRRTGRSIQGLYKARYFRDGVIGISSELHNTCIVYEDFSGGREILFRGNETLLFSGPQAVDNEKIAFIAARDGVRELLLYNFVSGELYRIEGFSELYMRNLGVSGGKLFFSHNNDDRMYKLGVIDLEIMQAVLSSRDFSGGVFNPVYADGSIYYRGAFFSGDGFLRFPENIETISGAKVDLQITKLNKQNYGSPAPNTVTAEQTETFASKPYTSFKYMNPLKFWLPVPLLRYSLELDNLNFKVDGAGIFSVMMDPADRHLIMATAYADITYRMFMVENFSWQTTVPGFPLTAEFSDKVFSDFVYAPHRETRAVLSGSLSLYPGRYFFGITLAAGYVRFAGFNGGNNAYEWEENDSSFYYSTALSFSNQLRRQNDLFGTGLSVNVRGTSTAESFAPRVEGIFRANRETRFPLSLAVYGAYDKTSMNLYGASRRYGQPVFNRAASREYSLPNGLNLAWISGSEMSVGLFSFEIQNNLSHIYFNRFSGFLSLRSVIYDSDGHPNTEGIEFDNLRLAQSLVLRISLLSSIIPVKSNPLFFEPSVWGAWKFSNTITNTGSPWGFGFGLNYRY